MYNGRSITGRVTDCFIHLQPERKKNHFDEPDFIHTHSLIIVFRFVLWHISPGSGSISPEFRR